MRPKLQLLLLFYITEIAACKQNGPIKPFHTIGDPAPALQVRKWFKGTPVQTLEKGKVYVVEFWATWCRPCREAMPHLSALARQYKGRVSFIAVDVWEEKTTPISKLQAFVNVMGNQMDFPVAAEDSNFMERNWLTAADEGGIPNAFVVNEDGKVVWIGLPGLLDKVLPKIVNNTWDINKALNYRTSNQRLQKMDDEISDTLNLNRFVRHYNKTRNLKILDSMLSAINEWVKKDPQLQYAPSVASSTFWVLLRTNPHKAYEYGKKVMSTSTYQDPAYSEIIGDIRRDSSSLNIPPYIYRLGAECYQAQIDTYGKLLNIPLKYHKMAGWYLLAGDKAKAFAAQEKAVEFSADTLKWYNLDKFIQSKALAAEPNVVKYYADTLTSYRLGKFIPPK